MTLSLYRGPFQPFLEEKLVERVGAFRATHPRDGLTVLVPNHLLTRHLRRILTGREGSLFNVGISTLQHHLKESTEELFLSRGSRPVPTGAASLVLEALCPPASLAGGPFESMAGKPGFHPAIHKTILELQEAMFEPVALRKAADVLSSEEGGRTLSSRLRTIADVWDSYVSWKSKNGFHDGTDAARAVLKSASGQGPLFLYGFYDATRLQEAVFAHWAGFRPVECFVPAMDREAFEYARPFVERLKVLGAEIRESAEYPSGDSPLSRLQARLFGFGGHEPDVSLEKEEAFAGSDLKVFLCPGEEREMREAAREMASAALEGNIPLRECAVLFRTPEAYEDLSAPVFATQEIPFEWRLSHPLGRTPEGRVAAALWKCLSEDFPRGTVMDLLYSGCVDPRTFSVEGTGWNPGAWDILSREAQVVGGLDQWRTRIGALMDDLVAREKREGKREGDSRLSDVDALRGVVDALARMARDLPAGGSIEERAASFARLLERIILPGDVREALVRAFKGLRALEGLPQDQPPFADLLRTLLEGIQVEPPGSSEGGIGLLPLMDARGVPFDVVALPGLAEKGVPRLVRPDPFLPDGARFRLNEWASSAKIGAYIPPKSESAKEERLLFALGVMAARKRLILTVPVLDVAGGQVRYPSVYVLEAVEAAAGRDPARSGFPKGLVRNIRYDELDRGDIASCSDDRERLVTAMAIARRGNLVPALAYIRRHPFYLPGETLLRERQDSSVFTVFDGMIRDKTLLGKLNDRFSLEKGAWSPTRLETYATCPLKYYFRYALSIPVTPEPEQELEIDAPSRGSLIHEVLEKTFARGLEEGWLKARDAAQAREAAGQEIERTLDRFEKDGVTGSAVLWMRERAVVRETVMNTLEVALRETDWEVAAIEASFGGEGKPGFALTLPDGSAVELKGRVDRVDLSRDRHKTRVVDYKSGSATAYHNNRLEKGMHIQLALYARAVGRLFPGTQPGPAVYEFVTQGTRDKAVRKGIDEKEWLRIDAELLEVARIVVEGVRAGLFPGMAGNCPYCDYRLLCGTGMKERAERKQDDPAIADLCRLEGIQ